MYMSFSDKLIGLVITGLFIVGVVYTAVTVWKWLKKLGG